MKRKKKRIRKSKTRSKRKPKQQKNLSTAIVKRDVVTPTVFRQGRERELTQSEIDLVHRTVALGTTADQFALFLWFCRKHQLDPVAKEVYCVLFNNTSTGEKDMVIITGIGGLRGMAARNHPADYGSTDQPIYTWFDPPQQTPWHKSIPESCTVSVWKKGADRPTTATLYWEEFAPKDLREDKAQFWCRSPKNQLAKCTEAQALRKAYPDLANIYVREELAQIEEQYTEGGRRIIPEYRITDTGREAVIKEAESQLAGNPPSDLPESLKKRSPGPRNDQPQKVDSPAPGPNSKLIILDWSADEASPKLQGDIAMLLPTFQAQLTMAWFDKAWHFLPKDAETIRHTARQLGYQITELMPKLDEPRPPVRHQQPTPSEDDGDLVVCRIKESIKKEVSAKTKNKGKQLREVRDVKVILKDGTKHTWRCWDSKYFRAFDEGINLVARFELARNKKFVNITRPLVIGSKTGKELES